MEQLRNLLDLVGARSTPAPGTTAERLVIAGTAFLGALLCSGLWGIAAGSGGGRLAIGNLAVVPVLVAVSTVASLPVSVLALRLFSEQNRASDLVLSHAVALFGGSLLLLLLAPVVALYQLSSAWIGPSIAIASVLVALLGGLGIMLRTMRRLAGSIRSTAFVLPAVLLLVLQVASLSQLASLAPPVMHARTAFGHGVDALVSP